MQLSSGPGKFDLTEVFRRVQDEMLSQLALSSVIEHSGTHGAALEQDWLKLFSDYLPTRYQTAPAFVINRLGHCSRQIDIAIFDTLNSPPLLPHPSGVHIPIESVYAVFEVKSRLCGQSLSDAGEKTASVRHLRTDTSRSLVSGVLASHSDWQPRLFRRTLRNTLDGLPPGHNLDLGCVLNFASFEHSSALTISQPGEALIFFLLRLIDRLESLGPAPRADLLQYAHGVRSFKK